MKYENIIRKLFPGYISKRELLAEHKIRMTRPVFEEKNIISFRFEQQFEPISAEILDDKAKRRIVLGTIDRDTFSNLVEWNTTLFPDGSEKIRGSLKIIQPR